MAPDKFWEIPETDVLVDHTHKRKIWNWCKNYSIDAKYFGSRFGKDVWRVPDNKERFWFKLRWE